MNIGFERHENGALAYYTVPSFDKTGLVRHGLSTRLGGVSTGETAQLNLGFNKKDTRDNVYKNFGIICVELGIERDKLVLSNQVHENRVRVITSRDCGKGIVRESDIVGIDALVCGESGVPFVVFCADCVPVLFLDTQKKVAALAHSGWHSTVKNIVGEVIKTMCTSFNSRPEDIMCAIGASIGQCCFEVDSDVAQMFNAEFVSVKGGRHHVDLWGVIEKQLTDAGVLGNNITLANVCTCCNSNEFFSSRAQNGRMGLMGAFMELR